MSCSPAVAIVGGQQVGASVSVESVDNVIYEVNFATLPTNTFADGNEVIDGLTWTVGGSATAGATWELTNGQGIRWTSGAVSAFTSGTQTAPHIFLPFSQIPNFDARYNMVFEVYVSAYTIAAGTANRVQIGNWGVAGSPTGSAARLRSLGLTNNAGTISAFHVIDAAAVGVGDTATGTNTIAAKVDCAGFGGGFFGTWTTTWPAADQLVLLPTVGATASGFYASTNRFVMAFPSSGAGNNLGTIERLRILRMLS